MDNKDLVKCNLKKILIHYGATPSKWNWQCIPGRHKTPNFDLTIKNNLCCCHCGIQGDALSVIAFIEGLDLKKDFNKIIIKGLDIVGEQHIKPFHNIKRPAPKNIVCNEENITLLSNIIKDNYKKRNDYKYFFSRGITEEYIYNKYMPVVCNPSKIFPKNFLPKVNNIWAYEYILPVLEDRKVVNCILRRNDKKSTLNKKALNLKGFQLKILNADYLKLKNNKSLFLTEGFFDALSYENEGYRAIALNTVTMVNKFLKLVELNINNLVHTKFFIAFDNDLAGNTWTVKLFNGLKDLNLKVYKLSIKGDYKDINDYYQKDRKTFVISLNWLKDNIIN